MAAIHFKGVNVMDTILGGYYLFGGKVGNFLEKQSYDNYLCKNSAVL
jgi:hypothetical protein